MEKRIYYLSNTVIPNTKREKNIHFFNVLTQVGVKQLTDFLRTVTAASDLVDCTLVNCENSKQMLIFSHTFDEKIEKSIHLLPVCKLYPTLLALLSHTASSVAYEG